MGASTGWGGRVGWWRVHWGGGRQFCLAGWKVRKSRVFVMIDKAHYTGRLHQNRAQARGIGETQIDSPEMTLTLRSDASLLLAVSEVVPDVPEWGEKAF